MPQSFRSIPLFATCLLSAGSFAQSYDASVIEKIKDEGLNRSQAMQTLSYLSDVIGPRLTASPSMKRANEWTRDKLTSWGLQNAHLEAWGPFGRGWELESFSAQVISPQDIPLIAFPKAWSPGVRHTTADVVLVDATDSAGLAKFKGLLKGKIVLSGAERAIPPRFVAQGSRYTDAELLDLANATPAPRRQPGQQAGGPNRPANFRAQAQFASEKLKFFMDEGALVVLDSARGDDGTMVVQSASLPVAPTPPSPAGTTPPAAPAVPARRISVWDSSAPKTVPQVAVSAEQYNRMVRMIGLGQKLRIELNLKVTFFDKDPMGYNTVAEIPGSDLKDQVVITGGHMDSWHAGTGATDNGAGVAVAMEAVRILKALDLHPRRTVRVTLWSGEEEGLFGSRAYVAQHLGEYPQATGGGFAGGFGGGAVDRGPLTKKPEWDKVSAYYNLDNGTGKIRGIYLQGNSQAGSIFSDWLTPFKDMGASTVTIRNTGSTDHVSFDAVGVPGFQFIQDTIEYDVRTHHTNQDVFDRIQADDLKQAAVIMAAFLYNTAMRDEMIPRKPLAGQ